MIQEILLKKSNKKNNELSRNELEFMINGYLKKQITDYEMSAFLMAIKINGMTNREIYDMTDIMQKSGDYADFSGDYKICDKHSTGGVSDTTTLILTPIVASLGIKMLKLSGRSLGYTGGTIDKLEAFKGYTADIPENKAKLLLLKNNACIITTGKNLAPADKVIYALRDLTGTVNSLPLIASSVMSKKLAVSTDILILDIKYGNGAFMENLKEAKKLGKLMKYIGEKNGKLIKVVYSDMNQPLGYCIGNTLEALEAISVLKGEKNNLQKLSFELASEIVSMHNNISIKSANKLVDETISNGKALEKFKDMISAQNGSLDLFEKAIKPVYQIKSQKNGILKNIDIKKLSYLIGDMGASRIKIGDEINYDIGIKTFHKINDKINNNDIMFEVYGITKQKAKKFEQSLIDCYKY